MKQIHIWQMIMMIEMMTRRRMVVMNDMWQITDQGWDLYFQNVVNNVIISCLVVYSLIHVLILQSKRKT